MRKFLTVALAALTTFGQQPAPGTRPTFSSSTNLVVVDVTVRDKSGKLIEGLSQKDFSLLEDGKPQHIKLFEFERLTLDPADARLTIDGTPWTCPEGACTHSLSAQNHNVVAERSGYSPAIVVVGPQTEKIVPLHLVPLHDLPAASLAIEASEIVLRLVSSSLIAVAVRLSTRSSSVFRFSW